MPSFQRPPPDRPRPRRAFTGPQADPAFRSLAAPEVRLRALLAHGVYHIRRLSQRCIGQPLGGFLLAFWMNDWPGAAWVERLGLPRHNLERLLGREALTLRVNPRELVQFAEHAPRNVKKKPPSIAFIWDGDWDLRRTDLRGDYWLAHMRDLDENRDHLEHSKKFRQLMDDARAGRPFRSHQEGIYLDRPERILRYLEVYLGFLDHMAQHGYDEGRAKDGLDVVISREGRLLKVNRGLHRLGMAQWIGLPSIPVKVRHVHRHWWNKVTQGSRGRRALERVREALPRCTPETQRGSLSVGPIRHYDADFWPMPTHRLGVAEITQDQGRARPDNGTMGKK